LNEFFHDLFPENKVRQLIDSLKILQDNLGEFQDLEVQQISLSNFIQAMEQETGLTAETRHAIVILLSRLKQRDQEVRNEFEVRFNKFSSPSNRKLYKQIFAIHRHKGDVEK
jgi:CHAD domain-containing protein